jgi:hypothetical protein
MKYFPYFFYYGSLFVLLDPDPCGSGSTTLFVKMTVAESTVSFRQKIAFSPLPVCPAKKKVIAKSVLLPLSPSADCPGNVNL